MPHSPPPAVTTPTGAMPVVVMPVVTMMEMVFPDQTITTARSSEATRFASWTRLHSSQLRAMRVVQWSPHLQSVLISSLPRIMEI